LTDAAMASHLDLVRLASMISLNTSGTWAHLWATLADAAGADNQDFGHAILLQ
jgi:hypothetical protein